MNLGVFVYNFNHKKSYEGLLRLLVEGYRPDMIFAQDKIELHMYQSKIRVSAEDIYYPHSEQVALSFDIPYFRAFHNSNDCITVAKKMELDVGIILGARILKAPIINAFKIGIINLHPGYLPYNRGLDNLKWAILEDLPQVVTAHLIDDQVDWGSILCQEMIEVYPDDTLLDLQLRLQAKELDLLIASLKKLESEYRPIRTNSAGTYRSAVPPELEKHLMAKFLRYKDNYEFIRQKFAFNREYSSKMNEG